MDTSITAIEAAYKAALQWKAGGHKGEGRDGHLLRDIRGSCTGANYELADKYIKDLQSH